MPGPHPATRKADLRRLLRDVGVATTVQLERRNLLEAADWLDLPRVTYTCRTRVTQDSAVGLTFMALEEADLDRSARDLMHQAGLAEARWRTALEEGEVWQPVTLRGRQRMHLPDAEIIWPGPDHTRDTAVEFDAGYTGERITAKLQAAAQQGYTRILWATSVHARTRSVMRRARILHHQGRLPGVQRVRTLFVDFWSEGDPYRERPRCHKPGELSVTF